MTRRSRRLVLAGAFSAPILIAAAACTFPEVTFGTDAGDQSNVQGGDSEPSTSDAASDIVIADGTVRGPDSQIVNPSACSTKPTCDCDEDGFLDIACDASVDAPGKKLGDCDDLDPLRHPDAGLTAEVPVGHDGDWDCDGRVDTYPPVKITCSGGLGICQGGPGFINDPGCGKTGDVYDCEGVNCGTTIKATQVTEQCK